MSMTIIPKLLDPDYSFGNDFSPKMLKSTTKTPSNRVQMVPLSAQRYYAGSVNYGPMLETEYLAFRQLFDVCIQLGYGCLFWDCKENQLVNEPIGTGNGTNRVFQLHKQSSTGSYSVYRTITRPVHGYSGPETADGMTLSTLSITLYDATAAVAFDPSTFDVDNTTGIVTFHTGHAPTAGHAIQANGYFFVPIYFPTATLENERSGSNFYIKNLMIEEVSPF